MEGGNKMKYERIGNKREDKDRMYKVPSFTNRTKIHFIHVSGRSHKYTTGNHFNWSNKQT